MVSVISFPPTEQVELAFKLFNETNPYIVISHRQVPFANNKHNFFFINTLLINI